MLMYTDFIFRIEKNSDVIHFHPVVFEETNMVIFILS